MSEEKKEVKKQTPPELGGKTVGTVKDATSEVSVKTHERATPNPSRPRLTIGVVISSYLIMSMLVAVGLLLYFVAMNNPQIFKVSSETVETFNRAVNAILLLVIPFALGVMGATARVIISGATLSHHLGILVASGMFPAISWIGMKSKPVLAIISPYVRTSGDEARGIEGSAIIAEFNNADESAFYSMALVAVLVGMFSSNVFIFINQRVEQLVAKSQSSTPKKPIQPTPKSGADDG